VSQRQTCELLNLAAFAFIFASERMRCVLTQ
jgi:hypothetical protein